MLPAKLQPCDGPSVSANMIPGTGNYTIVVEHVYTRENSTIYHILGNTTLVEDKPYPDGRSFNIKQTEAYAVLRRDVLPEGQVQADYWDWENP
jgi:hypothetical protein